MTELNSPEALATVEAARNFLTNLSQFSGEFSPRDEERGSIQYEFPDVVQTIFLSCGSTGSMDSGNIHFRIEGERLMVREDPDSPWHGIDTPEAGDIGFFGFFLRIYDPRQALSCLDDIYVGPFGQDRKVLRATLKIEGLHPPEGFTEFIERGLTQNEERNKHLFDVTTWTQMTNPGNLTPAIEFYLDSENRPLEMTIGRILPGDKDSFTINFSYK